MAEARSDHNSAIFSGSYWQFRLSRFLITVKGLNPGVISEVD